MHRRALLVTVGAVGLGGCLGDSGSTAAGDPADDQSIPGETASSSGTPTPLDADELLSVDRQGTVTAESEDGTRQFAAARVENTSAEPIDKVIVSAKWRDADGNVAATTSQWLFAVEPGDIWEAYVPAEEDANPADVTMSVEAEARTVAAGPLSAGNVEMTTAEGAAVVSGTVSNADEEAVFPTVFATFRDDAGTIIGGATAPVSNVEAGASVAFELSLPIEGTPRSAPTDYELVLDTPDSEGCLC